jgi:hypothetical protein
LQEAHFGNVSRAGFAQEFFQRRVNPTERFSVRFPILHRLILIEAKRYQFCPQGSGHPHPVVVDAYQLAQKCAVNANRPRDNHCFSQASKSVADATYKKDKMPTSQLFAIALILWALAPVIREIRRFVRDLRKR